MILGLSLLFDIKSKITTGGALVRAIRSSWAALSVGRL
jgi:hypothetical protein